MLILTRRRQEAIKIGHKVTVTILEIKGNQIRLGIEAPSDIPVHRHEIYERIQSENSSMSHAEYKQAMESKKDKHIDNGNNACTTYTTYTVEKEVDGNRLSLSRSPQYEQKADKRNKNIDVRRSTTSTTYTTYTAEKEIDGNY